MIELREQRAPRLRGRSGELDLLEEHVEALVGGRGGTTLILGKAGSGKTALLETAVATARQQRVQVLLGAGDAGGQAIPLGLLLDALVYTEDPPVDPDVLRELSRYPDQRFWLLRELQQQLESAALKRPLLIALDDIQWADEASLIALGTLPRRLASHGILWLLSVRGGPIAEPVSSAIRRLQSAGAVEIEVGPLDSQAVMEVASDVLEGTPDDSLQAVLGGVRGHPFLLTEMLRGLRDDGLVHVAGGTAQAVGRPMPERFLESVSLSLQRLPDTARLAVQMASVLGRRFSSVELAAMIERSSAELLDPLRDAVLAGFLTEDGTYLRFRHELVREAVDAGLPRAIRGDLQRRAVEVRLEHGAPPSEVATLVASAAEPGDAAAIDLLRRAAGEVGRVSPSVAAPLSRRALELTAHGDPARGMRVVETLNFLVDAGQAMEADRLMASDAEDLVDVRAEAEARLNIGLLMMQYEPCVSVEQCERGLALAGVPAPLRLQLLSLLSRSHELRGDIEAATEAAQRATESASSELIDRVMTLVPWAMIAFARAEWRQALEWADEAVKLQAQVKGAASRLFLSSARKTLLLVSLAQLDDAIALITAGAQSAQDEGVAANLRIWSMLRCRALLGCGLLADAGAEAEALLEMSDEFGGGNTGYINGVASYVLATVALHTGAPDELAHARVLAGRLCAERCDLTRRMGVWLCARLSEATEPDACCEIDVAELDPLAGGHIQASSLRTYDDSVALVRMLREHRNAEAREVAERLERIAEKAPDFPFLKAAAIRSRAVLEDDPDMALRAVALHAGDPRPLIRASALEDAGRLLSRDRREEAVELLDEALGLYVAAGADRDSARVRRRLRQRGARRASGGPRSSSQWPDLTNSELAVVRLVARGATNREVAEQLFVSPYTVNSHLRHVFSKLGIRSRVELARIAAERGLADEAD
jgi:DNA-binding CsgD family transcriptional regulator/tetratricopeptide (TPR) repeat protein